MTDVLSYIRRETPPRVHVLIELVSPQSDDLTLAEAELFPDDEIRVVDSKEHDTNDLAGLFPASQKGGRDVERGFTGTALFGMDF